MVSQHGVDTDKLQALQANAEAARAYATWLDSFIIPLLKKIGLKVKVKKTPTSYMITVRLPHAEQAG